LITVLLVATSAGLTEPAPAGPPAGLRAGLFDELVELYPDDDPRDGLQSLSLHTARGVPLGVHVLVDGLEVGGAVTLRVSRDGSPLRDARWCRLIDVPVEENTGLSSRTEQWDGAANPHVVRRAPFRIFEALAPMVPPSLAPASRLALRLEIPIAADAATGRHEHVIVIGQGPRRHELRLVSVVHQAVVPPTGRDTLHFTNWISAQNVARWHGLEPWSEPFWAMLEQYARLMARGRQNTVQVRWADMFERVDDGPPRLRRERLERYVRTFAEAGLHWIEGAPVAGRPGGDWSSSRLQLGIVDLPATSPEGATALAAMAGQLHAVMRANGWHDCWIQHLADEPTDTNAADYAKLAAIMREHLPGVPILEATMSRQLVGAVDIWCPQVHELQRHRAFFEQRRAAGDRLWVYTCLVPGGPWLNRLLDQERLRQTYIGWALVRYELDGFLHWGLNKYRADPFARSVVDHPAQPGTSNKLPAGDTHLVYPGSDGPWSSHRMEAHRIGMEDAELLRMLRARDPEAATAIIELVLRGFDDYDTDVAAYRAARRALLVALDG
jgi:hypothetical protein